MGLDIFRETYMNIDGETIDFPEAKCIFAKRRGKYILWVGVIEPERDKIEQAIVEPAYYRFAILELAENDEGEIYVKDYVYFDLDASDVKELMDRIRYVDDKMKEFEWKLFGLEFRFKKRRQRKAFSDDDVKMFV